MSNIEQSILNDDKMISFAHDKNIKLKEFRDSISESIHIEYFYLVLSPIFSRPPFLKSLPFFLLTFFQGKR